METTIIKAKKGAVIADGEYAEDESLVNIEIDSSVRAIGTDIFFAKGAFSGCPNLQTVVVPQTVKEFGCNVFEDCCSLETIMLPNFRTGFNLDSKRDDLGVFRGCSKLQSIEIIGDDGGLSSFDGAVYTKDKTTILYCPSGKRTIKFSEGVTIIDESAFKGSSIETIVIPKTVERIGLTAFKGCKNLKKVVFEGDRLESMALDAFDNCIGLEELVFPSVVEDYLCGGDDDPLCRGCSALKKVVLPTNLKEWKKRLPKGVKVCSDEKTKKTKK